MSDNEMLYCLIAFILGWLASRHMGNGFSVGAANNTFQMLSETIKYWVNLSENEKIDWCSSNVPNENNEPIYILSYLDLCESYDEDKFRDILESKTSLCAKEKDRSSYRECMVNEVDKDYDSIINRLNN